MAPTVLLFTIFATTVVAQELNSTRVLKRPELRIIRGQNAELGQFPWQAWIECIRINFEVNGCGGSLITASHILTAAHCVNRIVVCEVSLGIVSLKDRGYSYFVHSNNVVVYNKYQLNNYIHDIAIIRLNSPIQLTGNIHPIRLAKESQNSRTLNGLSAIISGWGKTRDDETSLHNDLQYANVKIISGNKCNAFYVKNFNLEITNGHICAGFSSSNVCNGDSGGPLAIYELDNIWTLIGIVSLGVSPCEAALPSVFTAIANYLPWIHQNTLN